MSTLRGTKELRARLRAIKVAFKPIGRRWAEDTVNELQNTAPRLTGKLRRSAKVKNASMTRATVSTIYYGRMLDRGTKAHDIRARRAKTLRFEVGGRTIFAKKVHRRAFTGLGFALRAGRNALRRNPMAETLIYEWNRAA